MREIERDEAGPDGRLGFERGFIRLAGERFELFQGIALPSGGEKNGAGREARVVPEWIRISGRDDLLIDIARLIFAIETFQAARFEIAGGKREGGRFYLRGGAMEKR